MRQLHEYYSKIMNNRPFTMPLNFPLSESEIEIRKQHHFKIWLKFYTRRLNDARNEVFLRQCLPLFEKAFLEDIYQAGSVGNRTRQGFWICLGISG